LIQGSFLNLLNSVLKKYIYTSVELLW